MVFLLFTLTGFSATPKLSVKTLSIVKGRIKGIQHLALAAFKFLKALSIHTEYVYFELALERWFPNLFLTAIYDI